MIKIILMSIVALSIRNARCEPIGAEIYYKYVEEIKIDLNENFSGKTRCKPVDIKYLSETEIYYIKNINIDYFMGAIRQDSLENHPNIILIFNIKGVEFSIGLFIKNEECIGYDAKIMM